MYADIISVNLIAQVHEEGHHQMIIAEIKDHRVLDDSVPAYEGYYTNAFGMKRNKCTTRGW